MPARNSGSRASPTVRRRGVADAASNVSPQCQPKVKRQRTDKVNPMLLLFIKQISTMTEEDVRQTAIDQHAELLALRSQVAKANKDKAALHKRKADMKKSVSGSGNSFLPDFIKQPKWLQQAAFGFWDATHKETKGKGHGTGVSDRQSKLTQMVEQLWGGEVKKTLAKDVKTDLKFSPLKIAHTLDMNVNLNYTSVDIFRSMEPGIKRYQRGIICGSSTVQRIHDKIYKPTEDILGSSFPAEYKGAVWTTDPDKALTHYFKDLYLSTGLNTSRDDPWIVTLTGDGYLSGSFDSGFAMGLKKVSRLIPH